MYIFEGNTGVKNYANFNRFSLLKMPDLFSGSLILKVEPTPSSLSTIIEPPIISQNRLLMANPRPVPPYTRVVDELA